MKRITDLELKYVREVLESDFRSSKSGGTTKALETAFAEKFGARFAISHTNGTATMHAALVAAGVGPGDEVIVPPLTMASTAFAVLHANAIPVFADVDPDTFTIDPGDIARKLTENTKAIITVSLYGLSPDMDPIMEIARERGLTVVEDNAQCFLGYYKGKIAGTIGHAASFSFQSSKHMTSGEGGMVLTDDEALADRIRRFSNLGYAAVSGSTGKVAREVIQNPNYERHVSYGFNYKISELCSAVALAQLERLEEFVGARTRAAGLFGESVKGCSWLTPQKVPEGYVHSYWSYVLKLDTEKIDWFRFRDKYLELGGDRVYAAWQLNYLEPVFRNYSFYGRGCPQECAAYRGKIQDYKRGLCPVAETLQPKLLQFKTNYYELTAAQRMAEALHDTINYFES
jgi:perosamine synthetase